MRDTSLLRHLRPFGRLGEPGGRVRFVFDGHPVGSLTPGFASRLAAEPDIVRDGTDIVCQSQAVLDRIVAALRADGTLFWRGEAFDILTADATTAVGTIDRGALPAFGLLAQGAHLNGLVRDGPGWLLWVSKRSATRPTEPGKLDHIAAGGVPAGQSPRQTLKREAWEEASLPHALATRADFVTRIGYTATRPEGLRRDMLHVFDLLLPPSFVPQPGDGEAAMFELWPLPQVVARLRETDDFKFNVAIVLLDLCIRRDALPPRDAASIGPLLARLTAREGVQSA
jgi:8-oxo-dGTP pyrophosphatase MutT (NUDIX family)